MLIGTGDGGMFLILVLLIIFNFAPPLILIYFLRKAKNGQGTAISAEEAEDEKEKGGRTTNAFRIGNFEFNLDRIIYFLRRDIKDDWFQDPLLFEDRLDPALIIDHFDQNILKNDGVYLPKAKLLLNVPKDKGTLRYSLETNFFDRIAYHAFVITLIEYFDPLLHRRVFNHRLDSVEFKSIRPKYIFLNSIVQWKKFEEFVRVDAKGKAILQTDIENCFDNIKMSDIEAALFKCLDKVSIPDDKQNKIRYCIKSLCECMMAWSFNGINGLPQNRDMSSFLANIYLMSVDEAMISAGYDYYRYMDDIRILCADKFEARLALKRLGLELRKLGLSLNSAKTEILEPNTDLHNSFLKRESLKLECIDSMINTKKKQIVALGFSEVRKLLLELKERKDYSSRTFRFAINRFCKIALCKDISKPPDFFGEITKDIIKHIGELPHVTDQFYAYLAAVDVDTESLALIKDYLLDENKSIYGWQNYHLWKLLTLKKYCNQELLNLAERTIVNNMNKANVAGALLYLGSCGDHRCRMFIANQFRNLSDFFLQRHALIAIQECEFNEIQDSVAKYVSEESRGIYKKLRKKSFYIKAPENIKYTDLIREVSFYA